MTVESITVIEQEAENPALMGRALFCSSGLV
jgi:hypothetical protein